MSKLKLYIAILTFVLAPTLSTILLLVWDNDYSLFASCLVSGLCGVVGMLLITDYLSDEAYKHYLKGYDAGQADAASDVMNVYKNNSPII